MVLGTVDAEGDVLAGLYTRIVVMQVAIILGGWVAQLIGGGIGTLVLLVIGKTLVELYAGGLSAKVGEATAKAAAEHDPGG
jgi:hypothetical protein